MIASKKSFFQTTVLIVLLGFVASLAATLHHEHDHDDGEHHAESCTFCQLHSDHALTPDTYRSDDHTHVQSENAMHVQQRIPSAFRLNKETAPRAPPPTCA